MNTTSRRRAGAWLGAGLLAAIGPLAALPVLATNPWFLDAPGLFLGVVSLPLAGVGALIGAAVGARPGVLRPLPLAFALLAPFALSFWPRPGPTGHLRLLVYGIDGATWEQIDPLGEAMPALRAAQAEGARATLRSMEPMFSPLLWTTMATGKLPEEHGVHGFHVQATDCRVARFWDVMEASGLRVGTFKWLVTYPPTKLAAFQVPAWLAPGPETWPEDLSFDKEIELSRRLARQQVAARRGNLALAWAAARYGVRFSTLVEAARVSLTERVLGPDPLRSYYDGQMIRVRLDRDVFVAALHREDPEVATFTDYATDAIAHRFWRYHEPAAFPDTPAADIARWGGAVRQTYLDADAVFAELRREVGPETTIVVVSDHGDRALSAEGEAELLAPVTRRLVERLQAEVGPVDVSRLGHKLVVAFTGPDPDAEALAVRAWLAERTVGSTGKPLYRIEEVPDDSRALGLSLDHDAIPQGDTTAETVDGEPLSAWATPNDTFSGEHDERGIFVALGPGLVRGARLPDLTLLDVAPTLLALVGLPAAADMTGRAPPALWTTPPTLPAAPPTYDALAVTRTFVGGSDGVNEDQLRALGYTQ